LNFAHHIITVESAK